MPGGARMAPLRDERVKANRRILAQADRVIPPTLASFQGIHVWVSQVNATLVSDGLDQDRLWFEVHGRLARVGLPVPPQRSWQQTPRFPCVGVLVHADRAQVAPPFYVFSIEVFFVQKFTLATAPAANAMRMTWCREAIGEISRDARGFDWSNLYNTLGSLVDQFLQESLGVAVAAGPTRACT